MRQKEHNKMCQDCPHLAINCGGTHDDIYSGCIWKTAPAESLERYRQEAAGIIGEGAENGNPKHG